MSLAAAHWSASWPVLSSYAALVTAHLRGLVRTLRAAAGPAGRERRDVLAQAAAFHAGLLIAAVALVAPLGYWSGQHLWPHAAQDVALAFVAPGLMTLGAPWQLLRRGIAARGSGAPLGPSRQGAGGTLWVASPVAAGMVFNAVWLGWHLPWLYDATRSSGLAAAAEYASFLTAGTVFWLQLIGSRPLRPSLAPMRRFALLLSTAAAAAALGMVLAFGSGLVYPAFVGGSRHLGAALADQQLGGAVLWMGILPPIMVVGVALLFQWFEDEESAALAAGLDRLVAPPKTAWPSGPGRRRTAH